jgi:hypothetical protein
MKKGIFFALGFLMHVTTMQIYTEQLLTITQEHQKQLDGIRAKSLSIGGQTEIINKLFTEKLFSAKGDSILDIKSLEEIDLYGKPQVATKLFGTVQTLIGQSARYDVITHPTVDQQTLIERQAAINKLAASPALLLKCQYLLKTVNTHLQDLLSLWEPKNEIVEKAIQQLYFSSGYLEWLNKSPAALEAKRQVSHIYSSLGFIHPLTILNMGDIISKYLYMLYLNKNWDTLAPEYINNLANAGITEKPKVPNIKNFLANFPIEVVKVSAHNFKRTHNPFRSKNSKLADLTLGDQIALYKQTNAVQRIGLILAWLATGYFDYVWILKSKAAYQEMVFRENISDAIHKKMSSIAQLISAFRELTNTCIRHPELGKAITTFNGLNDLFTSPEMLSAEMKELMALFDTSTLQEGSQVLSIRGRALAAYKLIDIVKDQFTDALRAIGELDMYTALALKVKNNQLCSATFISNRTPTIKATGLYNPLVKSANAVGQDLLLGSDHGVSNVLLTGPNGCGKSTIMKSVLYSLLSALTFKMAFAKGFELTPIDKIITYFEAKDNIEEGVSTFMAESARLESIEKTVLSLPPSKLVISFVDEGLKGTIEQEGSRLLYKFYDTLSTFSNSMFIGATHFELPTQLEKNTNGSVTNYYLEILETRTGLFKRTYKLLKGRTPWWFENIDLEKRTRFIEWIKQQKN